jgi:hypothetical protein
MLKALLLKQLPFWCSSRMVWVLKVAFIKYNDADYKISFIYIIIERIVNSIYASTATNKYEAP